MSANKYSQYGYLWGPNNSLNPSSCLQFADDSFFISNSIAGAQALLNVITAWCKWADMAIRIDKCSTFGMMKRGGQYTQFRPGLFIADIPVPPIDNGGSFVYLGKTFDFTMNNESAKTELIDCLLALLLTTSNLQIRPQSKLKIFKMYIPSQINFVYRRMTFL